MSSSLPSFSNNNNTWTIAESLKNNTLLYKFRNLRLHDFLCWPETWFHNPTPSHAPTLDTWKDFTLPSTIVSNTQLDFSPFSFALGPMHWSSSWQWQPCLAVCRLFRTLTWTELANFGFFFLKNVSFIPVTKPQNLCCMVWRYFTPPKQPGKLALAVFSEVTE